MTQERSSISPTAGRTILQPSMKRRWRLPPSTTWDRWPPTSPRPVISSPLGGDYSDGILLVGTRVKGDSMPRPIMIIPAGQSPLALFQGGYAIVALINEPSGLSPLCIGER